jgi:uncharacterized membrane protein
MLFMDAISFQRNPHTFRSFFDLMRNGPEEYRYVWLLAIVLFGPIFLFGDAPEFSLVPVAVVVAAILLVLFFASR